MALILQRVRAVSLFRSLLSLSIIISQWSLTNLWVIVRFVVLVFMT